jgi:hypothetical protein
MSSFGEYVDGRTIAIVGPAPVPYDQSAEIDAHDIVYRTSFGHMGNPSDRPQPHRFPSGTGTRVDMSFYNTGWTRAAQDGYLDDVYPHLKWAIHKIKPPYASPMTNIRAANKPSVIHGKKVAPNQVPIMLWDLTFYQPAKVTVFGCDFYLGPIETWYDANYTPPDWITGSPERPDPTEAMGPAFHDQELNRQIVRAVRDTVPWLAGDDRFLEALDVPREVHEAAMLQQSLRYKSPQTV